MPKKKQSTGVEQALAAVSEDAWRRLYAAAARVAEVEPWRLMSEDEIFAFVTPGSPERFVSVMGLYGEYRAVAVYGVEDALHLFRIAHAVDDDALAQELAIGTSQLHLSFEGARELEAAEKPLLKALGVTAVKRRWPIARSLRPGYHPYILEPDEVEVLTTGLEQLLDVMDRLPFDAQRKPSPDLEEMLVRHCDGGSWRDERRRVAASSPRYTTRLRSDWSEALATLPIGEAEFEIDMIPLPTPIGPRGERSLRGEILLVVEARSGIVLCMDVLAPETTWKAMRESVPARILQLISSAGQRPALIAVRAAFLSWTLPTLCKEIGIPVEAHDELPALDAVLAGARQRGLF